MQQVNKDLMSVQFLSKYARWNDSEGRRETWEEAVLRSVDFLRELGGDAIPERDYKDIHEAMLGGQVMPSMRLMASAGETARRNNLSIYNCSYLTLDSIQSFVEIMVASMCGVGVGFSVESQYVLRLKPVVSTPIYTIEKRHIVEDSSEGWATAFGLGLNTWWGGGDVGFDYSLIRPRGARLKTKGGTASGFEPLKELLDFARDLIVGARGRQLTPLEAHDLACKVGDCVIQGGVRRTALISLFDADDIEMMECKNGDNIIGNEHRYNANNSAVWRTKMSYEDVERQFNIMHEGRRGEPAIFSRRSANRTMPNRRKPADFGTNPCGEIALRPNQLCNLSIAVARSGDTLEALKRKVRLATIIGTIQATATEFKGLRAIWRENCEEERLLGVDITGHMDCPTLMEANSMPDLRDVAVGVNAEYAELLGINQSTSVTCAKPSGNSSVLLDCSAGIHPRYAPYYIRNMRLDKGGAIHQLLEWNMYPVHEDVTNKTAVVAGFPVKSPDGAITRHDLTALEHLEYWLRVKTEWTEHNPSVTIQYEDWELGGIVKFCHENQDVLGGVSFLPKSDAGYEGIIMPYEEITESEYFSMVSSLPKIDTSILTMIETADGTTSFQELACVGGGLYRLMDMRKVGYFRVEQSLLFSNEKAVHIFDGMIPLSIVSFGSYLEYECVCNEFEVAQTWEKVEYIITMKLDGETFVRGIERYIP